jgi:hypothetical protein
MSDNPDTPPRRTADHEQPSDELVLAAIERAARHRAREAPAVPTWAIFAHLAVPHRSAAARHVNVRLDVLHAAGWIEPARVHGISCWELTGAGHRHLKRARRRGAVGELPESPQHQAWRNARTVAAQEIERFRRALRASLGEAEQLLDARHAPSSDALFELADGLRDNCRRVASAGYCLNEWREPDDMRADIDSHLDLAASGLSAAEQALRRARRAGRRNIRLWNLGTGRDEEPPC